MADLIFATRGQAEALAAQEALATKARELKQEFEAGAKATKAWDAELMSLKRQGETALRSIQTEQEKIVGKITAIKEAQAKGLIPPKQAEDGIRELQEKWVAVDQATLDATEAIKRATKETEKFEAEQLNLKRSAESALRSIQTEQERIVDQIAEIEDAMAKGLVPPDEAEQGITRLRAKLNELGDESAATSNKMLTEFRKAFSPIQLVKVGLSFVGVNAAIAAVKAEIEDLQTAVDRRTMEFLKPKERQEKLEANAADARAEISRLRQEAAQAEGELAEARYADSQGTDEFTVIARQHQLRRLRRRHDAEIAAGRVPSANLMHGIATIESELVPRQALAPTLEGKLDEVARRIDAAMQKSAAADAALAQFRGSPEGMKLGTLQGRVAVFDETFRRLVGGQTTDELSTEELKKLEDIYRGIGRGPTMRRFIDVADRLDDGVRTEQEVIDQALRDAQGLRDGRIVGSPQGFDDVNFGSVTRIPPTPEELQAAAVLEEMARSLKERSRMEEESNKLLQRHNDLLREGIAIMATGE